MSGALCEEVSGFEVGRVYEVLIPGREGTSAMEGLRRHRPTCIMIAL